jgi:small subunit ribosomal protein S14
MATTADLAKMRKVPKYAIQYRNRCRLCGRPRGFIRDLGLCRVCFRKLAHQGELPGIRKSSW